MRIYEDTIRIRGYMWLAAPGPCLIFFPAVVAAQCDGLVTITKDRGMG
jgi:hypothetical protein